MKLTLISPITLKIEEASDKEISELKNSCTYTDKKIQFELQKFKKNIWFAKTNGEEAYQEKLNVLKQKVKVCLLKQELNGSYTVPSGLRTIIENKYDIKTTINFIYPNSELLPWAEIPDKKLYPYQEEIVQKLIKNKHARVEAATGLGKSLCILFLLKQLALKTVVMTPSTSISDQIYREFIKYLGKKYVGAYFDGKKESQKLITIGNAQSFTRIEPKTDAWNNLKNTQVFISDESHTTPAETLLKVCFGLLANSPYRFFFSATQIRNDGLDLLLDGITGPTVFTKLLKEGVDEGYLAKPVFRMIKTRSDQNLDSDDANEMTRKHLYYNPIVLKQIAEIANLSVEKLGHQVLILVEEVSQFTKLLPLLKYKVQFAHGPLGKDNINKVPEEFRDSDPNTLVREFDECKFPILVGTSCVSTGTDIKSPKTLIYVKGGKSKIEVMQSIGRATRLHKPTNKIACTIVDFDVQNIGLLTRHAAARRKIYNELYPPVEIVEW